MSAPACCPNTGSCGGQGHALLSHRPGKRGVCQLDDSAVLSNFIHLEILEPAGPGCRNGSSSVLAVTIPPHSRRGTPCMEQAGRWSRRACVSGRRGSPLLGWNST